MCVWLDGFHCLMMLNDWLLSVLTCKQWCFCRKTSSNNCCEITVQPNGKIKRLNLRSDWVQLFFYLRFSDFLIIYFLLLIPCRSLRWKTLFASRKLCAVKRFEEFYLHLFRKNQWAFLSNICKRWIGFSLLKGGMRVGCVQASALDVGSDVTIQR